MLMIRSTIFTLHSFVLGWSQFYIPLYLVHTISAIGPIFVCILNYFIYKVKINKEQMIGMAIAFGGILLAVNGKSIYHFINPDY
jgi:drug/metabolite transporter (DMT)-like permease